MKTYDLHGTKMSKLGMGSGGNLSAKEGSPNGGSLAAPRNNVQKGR
jgi:hypothetical protein